MKKEDGVISLVVLFIMLFLLIFSLTVYSIIRDKEKVQESKNIELQQIYAKSENEVKDELYVEDDTIIPIYNINELKVVGTGNYVEIKGKVYNCSINKNYELKNNIIIDVNEDLRNVNIGFNDYKFYLDTYNIDKSLYDCYYFYNNTYWKAVAYQKLEKDSILIDKDVFERNKFCDLKQIEKAPIEFLDIIKNEKGEISGIYQESQNRIPNTLEEIEVFKNHKNEFNKKLGEFYILYNVGENI